MFNCYQNYICTQLNRINPSLSNRVMVESIKIIQSKPDVVVVVPIEARHAAVLAAVCKLTGAFLNYYHHDPESAIHLAIDNIPIRNIPVQQIHDTLTVISNGIDEAIKNDTYHPNYIIPNLVEANKLPAQTGGQLQNDQKSKIRNRKYRKTRSIKKRRLTRRRRRQSKYLK